LFSLFQKASKNLRTGDEIAGLNESQGLQTEKSYILVSGLNPSRGQSVTIYDEIFDERLRLDLAHQPSLETQVREVSGWFKTTTAKHPYGLEPYPPCPVSSYSGTCAGPHVQRGPIRFLYRLSNIGAVIRKERAKIPYKYNTPEANFNQLKVMQRIENREWLPLSKFVDGYLPGRRNFTWWTPFDITSKPTLPNAHVVGLPNTWVVPLSALLRIEFGPAAAEVFGHVPTPIDAVESSVFIAPSLPGATIGVAIDISNPADLKLGAPELVATKIPVDIIDIQPVAIGELERKRFPVELVPLLPALLNYYRGL
jgi:hypothetical protein